MSHRPDFSPDTSGPYLKPRLIPKRPDQPPTPAGADAGPSTQDNDGGTPHNEGGAGEGEGQGALAARTHRWFEDTVVVPDGFRTLLVEYSHISPDKVDEHVLQVVSSSPLSYLPRYKRTSLKHHTAQRNRAWEVHPYPCLGQFRFLELNLAHRPGDLYPRLLSLLTTSTPPSPSSPPGPPLFLDVGACLGQDLRKLIADGAPPHTVAGAELSPTFIALGHELFRDRADEVRVVQANILAADLLLRPESVGQPQPQSQPLAAWRGSLKVVQLGMILHLFGWEEQITAFVNAIGLLRDEKGVLVIGQATGNVDGVETRTLSPGGEDRRTWKHNTTSFERLVRDVEARTGTRWVVKAELDEGLSVNDGKRTWDDPRTRRLLFEMQRVG